jgi:hypothetical protein
MEICSAPFLKGDLGGLLAMINPHAPIERGILYKRTPWMIQLRLELFEMTLVVQYLITHITWH